jgi:dTMP kinase
MTRHRGVFLTFEGPDGAGKSTHALSLTEMLRARGSEVVLTREPGGTTFGEQVREILLDPKTGTIASVTELLMYESIRAHHVQTVILPALKRGAIVISDRFTDASIAYQGYGRKIPLKIVKTLNAIATDGLEPDVTVLLDVNSEVGLTMARTSERGETGKGQLDRIESAGRAFHRRVRRGYHELASTAKRRIVVVKRRSTVEETFAAVLAALRSRSPRLARLLRPAR